jgi:hypothetical protein
MPRTRAAKKAVAAPTEAARPTELEVLVAVAFDQELEWYFSYAEGAKRIGNVSFLPTHESKRLAAIDDSPEATMRRGLELATAVQSTLGAMPAHHAGVLRAVFTPRRWPNAVEREFNHLSAIVVRLTCAAHPWPARNNHDGLETAAAHHLAQQLAHDRARPAALRKTARGLMGKAVKAYVYARAKGGPVAESA